MFSEISRVLKIGGRYICVSLAQTHVILMALTYFSKMYVDINNRVYTLPAFLLFPSHRPRLPPPSLATLIRRLSLTSISRFSGFMIRIVPLAKKRKFPVFVFVFTKCSLIENASLVNKEIRLSYR